MSKSTIASENPRSIRHQQILDIAADQPDLSMEEIAAEVPTASTSLVEQVLDEYGDPATETQGPPGPTESEPGPSGGDDTRTPPADQEFSDAQLEILRAVHANPTASQRTLAESIGLSAATISKRATAIEGLEWEDREAFVRNLFEAKPELLEPEDTAASENPENLDAEITRLGAQLERMAERLERIETTRTQPDCFEDPELAHKVIHACMESQSFSTDEELAVISTIAN